MLEASDWFMESRPADELRECPRCGYSLAHGAVFCSRCGEPISARAVRAKLGDEWEEASDRSRLLALLLCIVVGYLGVHRFYVGKIGTGLLWLFTGGLFGIGYVVDAILIAAGNFRDSAGLPLIFWDSARPIITQERT